MWAARRPLRSVLWAGLVLSAGCAGAGMPVPAVEPVPRAGGGAFMDAELLELERDRFVEREIAGGEIHAYSVALDSGHFLHVVVEQRGVDVTVTVTGPDGAVITEVGSPNGTEGPEPVRFAAPTTGRYLLAVRPLSPDAPAGRYEIRIAEQLGAAEYAEVLAEERAAAEAARQWLAANAVRLASAEAGRGLEDMLPLREMVGAARVVSLGEATHGTREFFQLKHRMLEFLVEEMGFDVFAIEAAMPEAFAVNEYVLHGTGDAAGALAGLYFWTWNTEEVLALIEWMRRYNADPKHTRKVKFYGFDMQSPARAARVALAYLQGVDPKAASSVRGALTAYTNPYTASLRRSADEKSAAVAAARQLLAAFDEGKDAYSRQTGERAFSIARQHAKILLQGVEMLAADPPYPDQIWIRDRSMAENVEWILEHEGPESKIVLWAHNGHVADDPQWMGSHLRRRFGTDMVIFGFAFNRGEFQAIEWGTGLRVFEVGAMPEGSLDAQLAAAGLQIAAADLRTLPDSGRVARWFAEPRLTRSIGAGYSEQMASAFLTAAAAPQLYDAILFVEQTTAARPVRPREPARPLLATPTNTGFEESPPGSAPAGWEIRDVVRSYGFEAVISENAPHSGMHSAVLRRAPGPHYGDYVGQLGQRVDAAPYRGRRIRLQAAVRGGLSGPESAAWLSLTISGAGLWPEDAFNSGAGYPVTGTDWKVHEIVADVPEDATVISYGLVMTGSGAVWLDTVSLEVVER
jgi:erythromycin esterase